MILGSSNFYKFLSLKLPVHNHNYNLSPRSRYPIFSIYAYPFLRVRFFYDRTSIATRDQYLFYKAAANRLRPILAMFILYLSGKRDAGYIRTYLATYLFIPNLFPCLLSIFGFYKYAGKQASKQARIHTPTSHHLTFTRTKLQETLHTGRRVLRSLALQRATLSASPPSFVRHLYPDR